MPFLNISKKSKILLLSAAFVVLFLLFWKLADEVVRDQSLISLDSSIANQVYALRSPGATVIMVAVTSMASLLTICILSVVVLGWLYLTKQTRHIVPLLGALIGAGVFTTVLKLAFARSRPAPYNALVYETGYSFPSGHSLIAVCFYGALAYFVIQAVKPMWAKITVAILGGILILAISFSRVYLGVHWPTDVLGSLLLGGSWLCLLEVCVQTFRLLNAKRKTT